MGSMPHGTRLWFWHRWTMTASVCSANSTVAQPGHCAGRPTPPSNGCQYTLGDIVEYFDLGEQFHLCTAEQQALVTLLRAGDWRTHPMNTPNPFTLEQAKAIGEQLGIRWDTFGPEQFRAGLAVELEHGTVNPTANVTNDDPLMTGKIAWAHLSEFPDYYTRLAKMEEEAKTFWNSRES